MSVKHALLALLEESPRYGSELKSEFERRTASSWPLNIGQVYTTLSRLQRDGLVASEGQNGEGHIYYRITGAGQQEVAAWFGSAVDRSPPPRDELAIKLALAAGRDGVDTPGLVQQQRTSTLSTLQQLTQQKARALAEDGVAPLLVIDALIAAAEAEARWLDLCEARLAATDVSLQGARP